MVDRNSHPKYLPRYIPTNSFVDNYLEGRVTDNPNPLPMLNTGLTRPIYNLNGSLHFSLPLEEWPSNNDWHPEAYLMERYNRMYTKDYLPSLHKIGGMYD